MRRIRSKEEAEAILADKGRAQARLDALRGRAKEETQGITDRYAQETAPLEAEIIECDQALEAWAKDNLGERKSLKLKTGTVGFRFTPAKVVLTVKKLETAVKRILGAGDLDHLVKVERKPDLKAMAGLPDQVLKGLGFKRQPGEARFFAKPEGDYGERDAA